jgi:hypothetical protein
MKRLILTALLITTAAFLFSQESADEADPEKNDPPELTPNPGESNIPLEIQNNYTSYANQRGDQFIKITLMVDLPLAPDMEHLLPGGTGIIGYTRFLDSSFALGGDVSFGYNVTLGSNIFTFVPILFKAMYQPAFRKFEFPISFGIGAAFENYLNRTYFGPVIKPEIAAYYRIVPEWSFGIHYGIYIMPQWFSDPSHNYTGVIQDLGISGRYHF